MSLRFTHARRTLTPSVLALTALTSTALGALSASPLAFLPLPPQGSPCGALGVPPCIPVGDCVAYSFCRPALPPGQEWVGTHGDPVGFEDDVLCDDFLGSAGGSGDVATIVVCNHGDRLVTYPAHERLDGPGEQGSPEIFVRWTSIYTASVTVTQSQSSSVGVTSTAGVGAGSSTSTSVGTTRTTLRYAWHTSSTVEVLPC
jgi:hypothetical protein